MSSEREREGERRDSGGRARRERLAQRILRDPSTVAPPDEARQLTHLSSSPHSPFQKPGTNPPKAPGVIDLAICARLLRGDRSVCHARRGGGRVRDQRPRPSPIVSSSSFRRHTRPVGQCGAGRKRDTPPPNLTGAALLPASFAATTKPCPFPPDLHDDDDQASTRPPPPPPTWWQDLQPHHPINIQPTNQ